MATTRELIREFSRAFDRPVNESWTAVTVAERELLGKLLFEEVIEYVTKGLGLHILDQHGEAVASQGKCNLSLELNEGQWPDPVECVDGLADVNVVAHFAAHWHGFNLDRATEIVNDSNMSKLGADGKPIINECQSTEDGPDGCADAYLGNPCTHLLDPSKPIGKILKGPNFEEPTSRLRELIMTEGNNA